MKMKIRLVEKELLHGMDGRLWVEPLVTNIT